MFSVFARMSNIWGTKNSPLPKRNGEPVMEYLLLNFFYDALMLFCGLIIIDTDQQ